MKKFAASLVTFLSVVIIPGFAVYAGVWFYLAREIQGRVDAIWDNHTGLIFTGDKPRVHGFPAPPKIEFSGKISDTNGSVFEFPQLIVQGFPLQGFAISAFAPQGVSVKAFGNETPIHLDNLYIEAFVPQNLPQDFHEANLQAWRDAGHKIDIENFYLKRADLIVDGKGYVTLDKNLQIEGQLNSKLSGLDELLLELVQTGKIKKKDALLAQSFLNLLSQKNAATGAIFIPTAIRLQDGFVYLGPLKAAPIPLLHWDK